MAIANFDPFNPGRSGIDRTQTAMYYERFHELLSAQGVPIQVATPKHLAIEQDHYELWWESVFKKK